MPRRLNIRWGAVILILTSLAFGPLLNGCGQKSRRSFRGKTTPEQIQIAEDQLRDALDSFEEFATSSFMQAVAQLDALRPDFRTRKTNLVQRTQFVQTFNSLSDHDNAMAALIEMWVFCRRLSDYFEFGQGSSIYGENQEIAVLFAKTLEGRIENIAKRFLEEDAYEDTAKGVKLFAKSNPINRSFSNTIIHATQIDTDKPGPFEEVLSLPMAPFKAIGGVDRTATSIHHLSISISSVADVVAELPDSARWQLLLLLMEMGETEIVKSFLDSMSQISASSDRFVTMAENFPTDVKTNALTLLEDLDQKQIGFQHTLTQAQATSQSIQLGMDKATTVAQNFQGTAQTVDKAAQSWNSAALSTKQALGEITKLKGPPKPKDPARKPFDITDYQKVVDSAALTASHVANITADLRNAIESENFNELRNTPPRLINLIAIRLAQLITLLFALIFTYRLLAKRYLNENKPTN